MLIEFPNSYWKSLSRVKLVAKNAQKQRYKRLREKYRPFVQLAASLAKNQLANGDMYVIEQPLRSDTRNEVCIHELEQSDDSYVAICNVCKFGLKNSHSGQLIGKPTWWLTNAPEIATELESKTDTDTGNTANAILRGYKQALTRTEPGRL